MSLASGRLRVVFDCNVFIQAIAFEHGPSAAALRLVESGAVELFISRQILAELRKVVGYQQVQALSPSMTSVRIGAFLDRLAFGSTLRRRVRHRFAFPRDPKDEKYLDLAHSAKAHFLVTRDEDLLSLMIGHTSFGKEFRQATHRLRVISPVGFLHAVEKF